MWLYKSALHYSPWWAPSYPQCHRDIIAILTLMSTVISSMSPWYHCTTHLDEHCRILNVTVISLHYSPWWALSYLQCHRDIIAILTLMSIIVSSMSPQYHCTTHLDEHCHILNVVAIPLVKWRQQLQSVALSIDLHWQLSTRQWRPLIRVLTRIKSLRWKLISMWTFQLELWPYNVTDNISCLPRKRHSNWAHFTQLMLCQLSQCNKAPQ